MTTEKKAPSHILEISQGEAQLWEMKFIGLFPTSRRRVLCSNGELLAGLVCAVKLSYTPGPPARLLQLLCDSGKRLSKLVKANVIVSLSTILRLIVLIRHGNHRTERTQSGSQVWFNNFLGCGRVRVRGRRKGTERGISFSVMTCSFAKEYKALGGVMGFGNEK